MSRRLASLRAGLAFVVAQIAMIYGVGRGPDGEWGSEWGRDLISDGD
jgi:hypothetical protein